MNAPDQIPTGHIGNAEAAGEATEPVEILTPVETLTIAGLRGELGLTQAEFAERIGLVNRSSVSLLERGLTPISLRVALEIERLSTGRIDAATLNSDVRAARAAGAAA